MRKAGTIKGNPQPSEDTPRLLPPVDQQDDERVLDHGAGWLRASNRKLETDPFARLNLQRRSKVLTFTAEPAMGKPGSENLQWLPARVMNVPSDSPATILARGVK
jgi:hypothetical protein